MHFVFAKNKKTEYFTKDIKKHLMNEKKIKEMSQHNLLPNFCDYFEINDAKKHKKIHI